MLSFADHDQVINNLIDLSLISLVELSAELKRPSPRQCLQYTWACEALQGLIKFLISQMRLEIF